ncbi:MAG: hypothetical protein ACT4OT_16320 [Acidobacteriota bacterium]
MFGKDPQNDEQLDRLGELVLRAVAADEQEIEAASTAPFLFTRVRARITEGRREESTGWQSLPLIAWRAIPAMALIAMLAGGLTIWTAESNTTPVGFGIYEEALSDTTNPGIEQAVLNQNSLSRDDVLTIVVERSNRENKK